MSGIFRSVKYSELKWAEVFEVLKYYKLMFYSKTIGLELQRRPMVRPCNRSLEGKYFRSWFVKAGMGEHLPDGNAGVRH